MVIFMVCPGWHGIVWCGGHGMVWYAGMAWEKVWPGGHGIVYGMA